MKYIICKNRNKHHEIAKDIAEIYSTDQRKPICAIIFKDKDLISWGVNKSRLKSKKLINLHKKYCIRKIFDIHGDKYWLCPGCASYDNHAEINAIKNADNIPKGSALILYGINYCCERCEKALLNVGIDTVYVKNKKK